MSKAQRPEKWKSSNFTWIRSHLPIIYVRSKLCSLTDDSMIRLFWGKKNSLQNAMKLNCETKQNRLDTDHSNELLAHLIILLFFLLSVLVSMITAQCFQTHNTSDLCRPRYALWYRIKVTTLINSNYYLRSEWHSTIIVVVNSKLIIVEIPWFCLKR